MRWGSVVIYSRLLFVLGDTTAGKEEDTVEHILDPRSKRRPGTLTKMEKEAMVIEDIKQGKTSSAHAQVR